MVNDNRIVPAGPFGMTPQEAADGLHDAHVELLMLRRERDRLRTALREATNGWMEALSNDVRARPTATTTEIFDRIHVLLNEFEL